MSETETEKVQGCDPEATELMGRERLREALERFERFLSTRP